MVNEAPPAHGMESKQFAKEESKVSMRNTLLQITKQHRGLKWSRTKHGRCRYHKKQGEFV